MGGPSKEEGGRCEKRELEVEIVKEDEEGADVIESREGQEWYVGDGGGEDEEEARAEEEREIEAKKAKMEKERKKQIEEEIKVRVSIEEREWERVRMEIVKEWRERISRCDKNASFWNNYQPNSDALFLMLPYCAFDIVTVAGVLHKSTALQWVNGYARTLSHVISFSCIIILTVALWLFPYLYPLGEVYKIMI